MKQGSEEWTAWRKAGLGGSDAPIIVGLSPYRTASQLYLDKIGEGVPQRVNKWMQRGLDLEPEARRAYEARTGNAIEPCTLLHPDWPIMRASLDGRTFDGEICVEIKAPGMYDHTYARGGAVPKHYMPQCQHLLAVSGASVLHYWSYRPDDPPALIVVEPDREYIEQLIALEREFWGYVERREPPPLTARERMKGVG